MPRRSSRTSNTSTVPRSGRTTQSTVDAKKPAKRQRSTEDWQDNEKAPKSTPKRSKYFEEPDSESTGNELSSPPSEVDSTSRSVSAPSDEAESFAAITDNEDDSTNNEGEESEDFTPKRRGRAARNSTGAKLKSQLKGKETQLTQASERKELWREGVRAGLGPGKEVFIELPQARDPGEIPYEDHTIHPNTLLFLKDLKANNDREWLKSKRVHCDRLRAHLVNIMLQNTISTTVHPRRTGTPSWKN